MDREGLFKHFYEQYRHGVEDADYLSRRAAVWFSANALIGTVLSGLAAGRAAGRFGIDLSEPTTAVVACLTVVSLVAAFVFMAVALFPRKYGRFSLPHEILEFKERYKTDLEQSEYPLQYRETAELQMTIDELCKVLASKAKLNAELNEKRFSLLGWSSILTFVSVGGLMILLASASLSMILGR